MDPYSTIHGIAQNTRSALAMPITLIWEVSNG